MKREFSILILILTAVFNSVFIYGQETQDIPTIQDYRNILPPSPNAVSLGVFGEIPVSYNTGTFNLSIPIFNLKTYDYNLPISLDYHSSGIKVADKPGIVGNGWALNAGGIITRTVMGQPDDTPEFGYFHQNIPKPETPEYSSWTTDNVPAANGILDLQPDIFYLNFAGYSGKMLIYYNGETPEIQTAPHLECQIILNKNSDEEIIGFEIKTKDGLIYNFGTSNYTESTYPSNTCSLFEVNEYISSWYLKSIKVPLADTYKTIYFTYEKVNNYILENTIFTKDLFTYDAAYHNLHPCKNCGGTCSLHCSSNTYPCKITVNHEQRFLTSVKNDNYEIKFFNSEVEARNLYKLDSIQIINLLDNTEKSMELEYYITGCRHFLKKIQTYKYPEPYLFYYNSVEYLPGFLSYSVDHWGYFNGENNSTLIPKIFYDNVLYDGADRHVNESTAKYGMLTKIKYPTKGLSEFTYESNDFINDDDNLITDFTDESVEIGLDIPAGGIVPQNDNVSFSINYNQVVHYVFDTGTYIQENPGGIIKIISSETNQIVKQFTINNEEGDLYLDAGDYEMSAEQEIPGGWVHLQVYYKEQSVSSENSPNKLVGGIRIKKIINSDYNGNIIDIKEFKYKKFNNIHASSAFLFSDVLDYTKFKKVFHAPPPYCNSTYAPLYSYCNFISRMSSPVTSLSSYGGTNVAYPEVEEYIGGFVRDSLPGNIVPMDGIYPGKGKNGEIHYKYNSPSNNETDLGWKDGNLLKKIFLDNNSDTVKLEDYSYEYETTGSFPGFHVTQLSVPVDDPNPLGDENFIYKSLSVYTGYKALKSKTTYDYYNNIKFLKDSSLFTYIPLTDRIKQKETHFSDGTKFLLKYTYPDNYLNENVDWIDNLSNSNLNNKIISFEKYILNNDSNKELINARIFKYKNNLQNKVYDFKSELPLSDTSYIQNAVIQNNLEDNEFLNLKASTVISPQTGNILEYKDADSLQVNIFWAYNNTLPIIKIAGNGLNHDEEQTLISEAIPAVHLSLEHFVQMLSDLKSENAKIQWEQFNENLRNTVQFKDFQIMTYIYDSFGDVVAITDINGKTTYYEYDGFGRLKRIKDQDGNIIKTYEYNYKQD